MRSITGAQATRLVFDGRRCVGVYPETKHPSYFRGIGLPMARKIIEDLGGTIGVESPGEGLGTTVTLTCGLKRPPSR